MGLSLQKKVSDFQKSFGLSKSGFLAVVISKNFWLQNWLRFFVSKVSCQIGSGFPKSASRFSVKVLAGKSFHFAKSVFHGLFFFLQSQASKIGYIFLAKFLASLVRAF